MFDDRTESGATARSMASVVSDGERAEGGKRSKSCLFVLVSMSVHPSFTYSVPSVISSSHSLSLAHWDLAIAIARTNLVPKPNITASNFASIFLFNSNLQFTPKSSFSLRIKV